MSFRACWNPRLEPPPKPRFSDSGMTFTDGNTVRTKSALPSAEPLSTTITSFSGFPEAAATTEPRYLSSRSFPFQFGITIEAAPGRARPDTAAARRRPNRSDSHNAARAIAIKNGDRSSSGSARRARFKKAMSAARLIGTKPDRAAQPHPTRRPVPVQMLLQLARFLVEAQRPGSALFQSSLQIFDFAGQARLRLARPLDLGNEIRLELSYFRRVTLGHLARVGLFPSQFLLYLDDAGTPFAEFAIERFRPLIAALELFGEPAVRFEKAFVVTLRLFEPLILGSDLPLEQSDMAFPLAQHIGGLWNVNEGWIAELRPMRADRHEEVRGGGIDLTRVHPHLGCRAERIRVKRDTLDMIFQKQRDVPEHGRQVAAKFLELEFVHVEGIGALRAARFGVIEPVRGRDNKLAAGRQQPPGFQEQAAPIGEMFDHLEGHNQIEARVGMRQGRAGGLLELQVGEPVVLAREPDGIRGDVGAHHRASPARQLRRAIAGAATGIEHPLAGRQPRRKRVARHVFIEQIHVYLTRDQPFAGELSHGDSPPAKSLLPARRACAHLPRCGKESARTRTPASASAPSAAPPRCQSNHTPWNGTACHRRWMGKTKRPPDTVPA